MRGLGNLLRCDFDSAAAILLAEQCISNELLESIVGETLPLIERDAAPSLLSGLLLELIDLVVTRRGQNVFAVYFS